MNVCITGATGFIGKQLCKKLLEKGNKITALIRNENKAKQLEDLGVNTIKCDVTDKLSIDGCLMGCDYLYHLANISRWWLINKDQYINVNVCGTQNMLEEALKSGVKRVIFTSSVAAIRQPPGVLSKEELEHCGNFESLYGKSKYLAEQAVLKFYKNYGLDTVILNPGVVIGPEDLKTFGKMLIDFLNERLKFRAFDNSYVPIVYLDDVVDAHMRASEKGKPGEKYIVVSENIKIIDIYKLAYKLTGKTIPRFQIPDSIIMLMAYMSELKSQYTGKYPKLAVDAVKAMKYGASACNNKAIRELGIKFMPVEEALDKTIKWYKENGYVNN